mmetsp:Transcript_34347/g.87391  ORF Transcript_34347/g.87391 Transcript_34347/m.87391 type:complete len:251 (+) Transcript_34347:380-1132(+)
MRGASTRLRCAAVVCRLAHDWERRVQPRHAHRPRGGQGASAGIPGRRLGRRRHAALHPGAVPRPCVHPRWLRWTAKAALHRTLGTVWRGLGAPPADVGPPRRRRRGRDLGRALRLRRLGRRAAAEPRGALQHRPGHVGDPASDAGAPQPPRGRHLPRQTVCVRRLRRRGEPELGRVFRSCHWCLGLAPCHAGAAAAGCGGRHEGQTLRLWRFRRRRAAELRRVLRPRGLRVVAVAADARAPRRECGGGDR